MLSLSFWYLASRTFTPSVHAHAGHTPNTEPTGWWLIVTFDKTMPATVQKIFGSAFFGRREVSTSTVAVIKWWEVRRIVYNFVVGATGILAIALFALACWAWPGSAGVRPELPDPPVAFILLLFVYGLCANVCYTGGWMCELIVGRVWAVDGSRFSQIALTMGFIFSIILTMVPAIFFLGLLIMRILLK